MKVRRARAVPVPRKLPRPKRRLVHGFPPDSIEAQLLKLAAGVPDEEWEKLPKDLSYNLDHYLYGAPKK